MKHHPAHLHMKTPKVLPLMPKQTPVVYQRGAVLVEFSLILVVLITLFYATLVYSIVFVTQQAVAYAAESGADAVVAVDPLDPGYDALATTVASARVTSTLAFLPGGKNTVVTFATPAGNPGRQVTVTVNYQFANWGFLVTGLFPLPTLITAQGIVNTNS